MEFTGKYVQLRSKAGNERYSFVVADEDENFWYSRAGVRFPKSSFFDNWTTEEFE